MSIDRTPPLTWRMVALVLAVVLTVGWGDVLGWWPLWVLIGVLTVDGLWAWIALTSLLRRQSRETPRVSTPSPSSEDPSVQVAIPDSVKKRAKEVRERLRTDKLVE